MTSYTVELLDGEERGIRVECDEHGDCQEYQPGSRTVSLYCDGCPRDLGVTIRTEDRREMARCAENRGAGGAGLLSPPSRYFRAAESLDC